jgi:lysophospholipid acyltransferase (LPLAT)-like uncharacterized protein
MSHWKWGLADRETSINAIATMFLIYLLFTWQSVKNHGGQNKNWPGGFGSDGPGEHQHGFVNLIGAVYQAYKLELVLICKIKDRSIVEMPSAWNF